MNSDFKALLQSLHACEVRYLVAGGYAVIHYSQPRYTKDIDLILAKETAARPQDLADLDELRRLA